MYFHFGIGRRPEFVLRLLTVEVALEVCKRYLVARLVLPILLTFLLNSVVGEMDHLVRKVLEVELFACCADIAFLEPVALGYAVCGG